MRHVEDLIPGSPDCHDYDSEIGRKQSQSLLGSAGCILTSIHSFILRANAALQHKHVVSDYT